jgi:Arc/MetJ-type ribon-helix-helix transcriptional regulator
MKTFEPGTCAQRVESGLLLERIVSMNTEPTTLALPSDLLAAVDRAVQEGQAPSGDELVESALRRQLAELRRSALDVEFRHMADDIEYQRDVHQILAEFAKADWETLHEEPRPDATNDRRL